MVLAGICHFLIRSLNRTMKCLFRCFFATETPRHRSSSSISSKNKDQLVVRDRLVSLLVAERDSEESCFKDGNDGRFESPEQDSNDIELKDEAKFLKSCGTILETPVEIRKASERVKDLLPHDVESETSKYHSWLPSTSIEKLHLEGQENQLSISSINLCDDLGSQSGSPVHEPNTEVQKSKCLIEKDVFLFTPKVCAVKNQCGNKSVRFELEPDKAFLSSSGENTDRSNSPENRYKSKYSPYPTPLKLSDEMQTPGTVYPLYSENLAHGEQGRVRSQYVYNVLNPVQNFSQLMALKEADYKHTQVDNLREESLDKSEHATPQNASVSNNGREDSAAKEEVNASLSHWLKRSSNPKVDSVENCGSASSGGNHPGKASDMDRPILGTVAAHWNANETSPILPKWWDGNGIPNSTTKYKEDQKVSWHATPFEERLEKALSNETLVSQRRLSNEPVEFVVENEENDTAASRLQASKYFKPVVSF